MEVVFPVFSDIWCVTVWCDRERESEIEEERVSKTEGEREIAEE